MRKTLYPPDWASIGSTPTAATGRGRPNPTAGSRSWHRTVPLAPTSKTPMNIAGSGDEHSLPACRGGPNGSAKAQCGSCAIEDGAGPRSDFGLREVDRTPDCAATQFCDPRPGDLTRTSSHQHPRSIPEPPSSRPGSNGKICPISVIARHRPEASGGFGRTLAHQPIFQKRLGRARSIVIR